MFEIDHHVRDGRVGLIEGDANSADARAMNRDVLLLSIAEGIGKLNDEPVGVGGNKDGRLDRRRVQRERDPDVASGVTDLDVLNIRRGN